MNEPVAVMSENDIRPSHLMQGQAERFAADIRRLLRSRDKFVAVPCPACESWSAQRAFVKYELDYLVCEVCGTMYVSPRPPPEVLADYYASSENYQYWNQYIFPASEEMRRAKIFRPRAQRVVELCKRHSVEGGVLLEAGAGFGTFCEEVEKLGVFRRVIAVEPTPDLAATCRGKGLEVIEQRIEEVQLDDVDIQVVASFEVIEHLYSPREFLAGCHDKLSAGGLLVITCPNVRGFDILVLQGLSSSVDIEHLNYFHPQSLSRLVSESGFKVVEALTPGELDAELVRKSALAGEIDLNSQPFLKQVLLDEWQRVGVSFQRFLAANRLSSHLWLVARKPES